jgi:hypothetical protein
MSRMTGVHGVGNHRPDLTPAEASRLLSTQWGSALVRKGSEEAVGNRVDLRVAYYAHHLQPEGRQGALADDLDALDDETATLVLVWAAQLGAPREVAQGVGTAPLRQVVAWVAEQFGLDAAVVRWLVTRFFREVNTYFQESAQRAAVQRELFDAIVANQPQVVLAHSLGSVVAYETLWARPELQLELLVTLGSPLAMPDVVFDRLIPRPVDGRGARPPGVGRWVNVADRGDLFAIPRKLTRRFDGIHLDREDIIHRRNFHDIRNYLKCPVVQEVLAPYLPHVWTGIQSGQSSLSLVQMPSAEDAQQ